MHAGKHPLGFMQAQFWQVSRLCVFFYSFYMFAGLVVEII
jgi:hypothetical protein